MGEPLPVQQGEPLLVQQGEPLPASCVESVTQSVTL
jgi:hypothetical protein